MSAPTRFLTLVVTGWIAVRAVALGVLPGGEAAAAPSGAPTLPPPVQTDLTPPTMAGAAWPYPAAPAALPESAPAYAPQVWPVPIAVYRQVPYPVVRTVEARSEPAWSLPPSRAVPVGQSLAEPAMAASHWPLVGASAVPAPKAMPVTAPPARFDRLQLATWAMVRDRPGPQSLAGTGTLGGSQAGMRFLYRFDPRLAASLRLTAPLGTARRGGDVAVGVRYAPFVGLPVAFTLERRQGFGALGGPTGFAVFAEGGLDRQLAGFRLDSYIQAGMVAGKDGRMAFVDGAAVMTRPLWRNIDIGAGVWGGRQPGLTRLDIGPRATMRVGRGIRASADYRVKVAGNAQPGSGAVITLAGDF